MTLGWSWIKATLYVGAMGWRFQMVGISLMRKRKYHHLGIAGCI